MNGADTGHQAGLGLVSTKTARQLPDRWKIRFMPSLRVRTGSDRMGGSTSARNLPAGCLLCLAGKCRSDCFAFSYVQLRRAAMILRSSARKSLLTGAKAGAGEGVLFAVLFTACDCNLLPASSSRLRAPLMVKPS